MEHPERLYDALWRPTTVVEGDLVLREAHTLSDTCKCFPRPTLCDSPYAPPCHRSDWKE